MDIRVDGLDKYLGDKQILHSISMAAQNKEMVGIIGPNGSGKSTLLKCIYRVLKPEDGEIFLGGDSLFALPVQESAKRQAVLAQHHHASFDFKVLDVVLMGRSPYKRILDRYTGDDYEKARRYLEFTGMADFAGHSFASLSGGEQQRVMLARALTQEAPCLILDEPTNHLDIRYQLQIMESVRNMKLTVIAAIHDLNIAAAYCDRLIAIKDGRIIREGVPDVLLTEDFIFELYGVHARILHLEDGSPVISYHL
ncbi:MAG: ABC transporter ATP-binding protein [Anaerovibrio sp.]